MRYCRVARRCVALVAALGVLTVLLLLGAPPTAPPRRFIPPSQSLAQSGRPLRREAGRKGEKEGWVLERGLELFKKLYQWTHRLRPQPFLVWFASDGEVRDRLTVGLVTDSRPSVCNPPNANVMLTTDHKYEGEVLT
uniref:Uncharacterized protein n=1 Tax=Timema genevievae TaxID=629358 RepID=A0A7R9K7Q4_TIMGE|nr:unnamed protein product [Timema genevievae]